MAFLWRGYQALIKAHPLRVNMATSGTVMLAADAVAQHIEAPDQPLDRIRSSTMTTWNSLVFAPCFFYWFGFLDRCFPGTSLRMVTRKVIVNQVRRGAAHGGQRQEHSLFSPRSPLRPLPPPAYYCCHYYAPRQLLITVPINSAFLSYSVMVDAALRAALNEPAGSEPLDIAAAADEIVLRCTQDLGAIFERSACIWTPVNTLNFLFCPPHLRVLPTIVTSCAWNTYLSLTAHHETTPALPHPESHAFTRSSEA